MTHKHSSKQFWSNLNSSRDTAPSFSL